MFLITRRDEIHTARARVFDQNGKLTGEAHPGGLNRGTGSAAARRLKQLSDCSRDGPCTRFCFLWAPRTCTSQTTPNPGELLRKIRDCIFFTDFWLRCEYFFPLQTRVCGPSAYPLYLERQKVDGLMEEGPQVKDGRPTECTTVLLVV